MDKITTNVYKDGVLVEVREEPVTRSMWKGRMHQLDANAPRILEDLLDLLIDNGTLTKADLPNYIAMWYDARKGIRTKLVR